jgi:predicted MFS family arabinose efflux permease
MAILIIVFIPNSPVFWIAAAFFILRMMLMNVAHPVTLALQMNLCKETDRATLSSANAFSWQISQATGTVIGGFLFAGSDLAIPFYVTAGFYVVYIVTFWLLFRVHEDRPAPKCAKTPP